MKRFVAVFDASPLESAPWMNEAARSLGLVVVSISDVSQRLAEDPKARALLLQSATPNRDAALDPYSLAAFEALAGSANRVAEARATVQSFVAAVPPAQLLEVSGDEAAKAKAAVDFLRRRGGAVPKAGGANRASLGGERASGGSGESSGTQRMITSWCGAHPLQLRVASGVDRFPGRTWPIDAAARQHPGHVGGEPGALE